jgi:uncharacterized protein YihD (DUF1040 family)
MGTATKKVYDKLVFVLPDENLLHAYRMREMAIYDYISSMSAAKERGKEEGIVISEQSTATKKVYDKLVFFLPDENLLHTYRMREMAIYDYISGMNAAYERGFKIGLATTLIRYGFSIEKIAKRINGTEEEVIKILKEEGLI